MSIFDNDYYYTKPFREGSPSWYRLERLDYCESYAESNASKKRGLFARRSDKKRSK